MTSKTRYMLVCEDLSDAQRANKVFVYDDEERYSNDWAHFKHHDHWEVKHSGPVHRIIHGEERLL